MTPVDVVAAVLLVLFAGIAYCSQDDGTADMYTALKHDVKQRGGSRPRRSDENA